MFSGAGIRVDDGDAGAVPQDVLVLVAEVLLAAFGAQHDEAVGLRRHHERQQVRVHVQTAHVRFADERHLVARHDQIAAARTDDAFGERVGTSAAVAPAQADPDVATEEPGFPHAVHVAPPFALGHGVRYYDIAGHAPDDEQMLREHGVTAATQWAERVARLGDDDEREAGGATTGVGDVVVVKVRVHGSSWEMVL